MRIASIKIGYDCQKDIIGNYSQWNRDHTTAHGGTLMGYEQILNFIASLRNDGYKGRQLLKIELSDSIFSEFPSKLPQSGLEKLADESYIHNVEVITLEG